MPRRASYSSIAPITVEHLMVGAASLQRANSAEEAAEFHTSYDVIPSPRNGPIRGYFLRGDHSEKQLTPGVILSINTRVYDLPGLLAKSAFYFVIAGNKIAGYVHYSDLNRPIAKVPFFAALQTAEKVLWDRLEGFISEDELRTTYGAACCARWMKARERNKRGNVDLGWEGIFTFPTILRLARFHRLVKLTDDDIEALREMRNRTTHSDRTFIRSYDEIPILTRATRLSERIIGSA